jgi:predicted amidohydrolase YtcJ
MPRSLRISSGRIESATPSESSRLFIDGREVALPRGAVILPGFVDTHCHLIGPGMMADRVGLQHARSAEECARLVAVRVATAAPGDWIFGFGWNQDLWPDGRLPDRSTLDAVAPDHPVALYRIDTHAAWLNTRALHQAGITPGEIEGGKIEVDEEGEMTGILVDNAVKTFDASLPEPGVEQRRRWIEYGVRECLRYGITEIHDMNVEPERLEPMTLLAEAGGMRLRCNVFLEAQRDQWRAIPQPETLASNLHIVGVKYFTDGALGSRGALLLEPYSDASETRGLELMSSAELVERASGAIEYGYAVATHAIGDAANRLVLDAYAVLRANYPEALLRIEHAQIVHPDDVPRFALLGVIPAMQPTHCTSDAAMAESRLGPRRCSYAYGWRSLRSTGVALIGGSDFPVESADPLPGIRAFHFREPVPGRGAWHPEQAVTRGEALDAYTRWAPLGIPGNTKRGSLEPGYAADVVVLDGDPFEDRDARVLMTIVGGRIEYTAR